ncbi:MAG TPA: cardiolipin synthase [Candidatus Enterocloster excrementigallinarum]|uniref:Cardiolipin synthase n=2 Tax=Clostridia TaxID=186801 RepID=A0A9D2TG67_9FIRM|nr:cardiolipin synthase [Candidatus Merdivicinus excrementipullorum]HJC67317.1 cardiolipin synthase [Candidatus Enterocloster excrementigallinarum]
MKKILQLIFHRVVIGAVLMLLQLALLVLMMVEFQKYFVYFYAICTVISILVTLYLVNNNHTNPAYKIAWMIPILLVPVFGGLFYIVGRPRISRRQRERMSGMAGNFSHIDPGASEPLAKLQQENPSAAGQSRYIERCGYCPPYENTTVEYLPLGEVKFERMLTELKAAKKFIFLEYFIIQEGKMWDPILEILEQKVKEGVEVRVMYDDFGCMMTLPARYWGTLEKKGIQCCVFNPFVPVLSLRFNNRDHRKICVIDGWVGITGGINLADEYINAYPKHGHWKDVSILLKGDAVWGLTKMFLSMWDYLRKIQEDYNDFRPGVVPYALPRQPSGYVQPYSDSPLDDEAVGETVYLNLINKAERYVYICTPYLIISNEMITALCTAAKSGVDVRIITPHVADKWYVHAVTRAYYQVLVEAGVKIYEYTPGFIHAKTFVVDDIYGVAGTINLDFRSLYLHFECAAWMYKTPCLADMKEDFLKTQAVSQEITLERCQSVKLGTRLVRSVLRVFAPLM